MRVLKKYDISIHCILASLYFLMLPLTISVNSAGASFLKLATIPIGMFFLVSLFFYKKDLHINIVHIMLAAYTVITVFTMFVCPTNTNFENILGYFLNAALFICISVIEYNEKELKIFEYVQIALLIIITAITFYNDTTVFDRATLSIFGQTSDPNYYVGFFIFPLTVVMKKICESKHRIFYIIIAFCSLYAIFLSGSRGGLLAILVTIAAFAVIYPKKAINKLFVMICMFLAVLLFWFAVRPFLPEQIIDRMSIKAVIETGGTNRVYIWESMMREIFDSPKDFIFGRGLENLHRMIISGKEVMVYAHNHLVQVMYGQGVVGVISFLMLVSCCIFRCIGKRKCVAVALFGMLALSVSLSFNPSLKSFWNIIPYAAFAFSDMQVGNIKNSTMSDDADVQGGNDKT